jgi:hypothetical protein
VIYALDLCREGKGGGMDPTDGLGKCGGAASPAVHHRALHIDRAVGVPLPLLTGAVRVSAGSRTTVKHDIQRVHLTANLAPSLRTRGEGLRAKAGDTPELTCQCHS